MSNDGGNPGSPALETCPKRSLNMIDLRLEMVYK